EVMRQHLVPLRPLLSCGFFLPTTAFPFDEAISEPGHSSVVQPIHQARFVARRRAGQLSIAPVRALFRLLKNRATPDCAAGYRSESPLAPRGSPRRPPPNRPWRTHFVRELAVGLRN